MNVRFLTEPNEVAQRWSEIAPLLARVVQEAVHGEFTLDDIKRLCEAGRMVIGICEHGGAPTLAIAFEFRHYPQFVAVNIVAMGGAQSDLFIGRFIDRFKQWVAQSGAVRIEASCSQSMARLLKKYGFGDLYQQVALAV